MLEYTGKTSSSDTTNIKNYKMRKIRLNIIPLITFCAIAILISCKVKSILDTTAESIVSQKDEMTTHVVVPVANYIDSSGTFLMLQSNEGDKMLGTTSADQWLALELDVPVEGRYKTEVLGRSYNITGDIKLDCPGGTDSLISGSRDGSPLNAGKHKIKLHFKSSGIFVNALKFTLLKNHQYTPENLTQNMNGDEWKLVWSDEFDGAAYPDTSKWTYDIGDWGWGNNELQYYTENRLENARQEDGNLVIEARKKDAGHEWTSARLTTRGKTSFLYGRIEMKAKVPPNRGNWAAGWTLGDDYIDELSWPYCGEIDILETVGYEIDDETGDGKAHASIHCGAYYFKLNNQPTAILDIKNMNNEFHTYTIDWSPSGIQAYVDDQLYFSYTDTSTELAWPFGKPQNLILNLAMGGGWGGLQGLDESVTSQQLVFDYVRVYERH
jgi:beta-glucanase (GH16 family)